MRKPDFCICENKDADQLRGNREADQRLCFRYIDTGLPHYNSPHCNTDFITTRSCLGSQMVIFPIVLMSITSL